MALAFRASATVEAEGVGYPVLINDVEMGRFSESVLTSTFGPDQVSPVTHPYMTAEDFAYYLQKVPGAFLFLGNDTPDAVDPPSLHSPHFVFNDDALVVGMESLATIARDFLEAR